MVVGEGGSAEWEEAEAVEVVAEAEEEVEGMGGEDSGLWEGCRVEVGVSSRVPLRIAVDRMILVKRFGTDIGHL